VYNVPPQQKGLMHITQHTHTHNNNSLVTAGNATDGGWLYRFLVNWQTRLADDNLFENQLAQSTNNNAAHLKLTLPYVRAASANSTEMLAYCVNVGVVCLNGRSATASLTL
jgi:hypothetical protein